MPSAAGEARYDGPTTAREWPQGKKKHGVDHTLQEIRKFQTSFPLLHLLFFPCQQGDEEQLPMLFGEETPPSWTS